MNFNFLINGHSHTIIRNYFEGIYDEAVLLRFDMKHCTVAQKPYHLNVCYFIHLLTYERMTKDCNELLVITLNVN